MISIVMPVRNSAHTIDAALASLLASPLVGEILIADGASEDGTPDKVRANSDSRVRLISTFDSGIYNGANKAIAECTFDYIMFMNSNDFLNPTYLDTAMRADPSGQADYFYGCISMQGQKIVPRLRRMPLATGAWQVMPFPHVSMIIRRSLHQRLGGYDESFQIASDLDYINRLLLSGARGVFINEIAADCAPGGVSSKFRHISEAKRVAIKNGRSTLFATTLAFILAIYRLIRR
jgi:glycosyltransferase involved in cell wall biosynthesis